MSQSGQVTCICCHYLCQLPFSVQWKSVAAVALALAVTASDLTDQVSQVIHEIMPGALMKKCMQKVFIVRYIFFLITMCFYSYLDR